MVAGRFGRATMEAIHNFKTNKPQTIAILKKYAKTDVTTLDTAHSYSKGAIPDLPNPPLKGRNENDSHRDGPRRPGVIAYCATTMIDASIVKMIDDEGFLKKIH